MRRAYALLTAAFRQSTGASFLDDGNPKTGNVQPTVKNRSARHGLYVQDSCAVTSQSHLQHAASAGDLRAHR